MKHEHEIGSTQASTSAREKLEQAVREYLESCLEEGGEDPGILTGWLLVTEETSVVSRKAAYKRAVRDFQSPALTMGLIRYADAKYSSIVADNI